MSSMQSILKRHTGADLKFYEVWTELSDRMLWTGSRKNDSKKILSGLLYVQQNQTSDVGHVDHMDKLGPK